MENPAENQTIWKDYFEKQLPLSFRNHEDAYIQAAKYFYEMNPSILDPQQPKTFVLGGSHPRVGNEAPFMEFCQDLHKNPEDHQVLIDMNLQALTGSTNKQIPNRAEAKLEALPFDKSVDFLILDRVLELMEPEQIRKFAESASHALTPDGLILAATSKPSIIPFLDRIAHSRHYQRVRMRPRKEIESFTGGHLKTVLVADAQTLHNRGHNFALMAFARKDSSFPVFSGKPLNFTGISFPGAQGK
jgi:hypothetical protein